MMVDHRVLETEVELTADHMVQVRLTTPTTTVVLELSPADAYDLRHALKWRRLRDSRKARRSAVTTS